MKSMKWKVISLIMLVISAFCFCFVMIFVRSSQKDLERFVDLSAKGIHDVATTIQEQTAEQYRKRIKSFLNYHVNASTTDILQAFAEQDRDELLRLTTGFFEIFKKENPDFSTFSWILPDNTSFLLVHNPGKYGADVSLMRPDVVSVNKDRRQYDGFAASPVGLQYRVVSPVEYNNRYIGAVQFGFKDSLLLDVIEEKLQVPIGLVIPMDKFQFIKKSELPELTGSSFAVQSRQIALFKDAFNSIDWGREKQQVMLHGKAYVLLKVVALNNHVKETQGHIFVALDISQQIADARSQIIFIVTLSSMLLLLSFLILYFSYGALVQKITDLQVVEKVNRELEVRVEERTRELQKNEEYLKSIFNAPGEAIFIHDAETGAILDVNQAMLDMYGFSREEALAMQVSDFRNDDPPYNQEEIEKKIALAVQEGPQVFEWLAKRKNGERFWTEIGLKLTESGDRSYVIAVVRNIDAKKKAEKQLMMFKTFAESSSQGMGWANLEGDIKYINTSLAALLGKEDTRSVIGKNVIETCYPVEEQQRLVQDIWPRVLADGIWSGKLMLQQADGRLLPTHNNLFLIHNESPEQDYIANIVIDISKQEQMEEELLKVRKLESVGVLAGGIAHDFNNILSAILGNIELASFYVGEKHKAFPLLAGARKASSRATKLTQQLLTFAKGGDPLKEATSLSQLIRESADFVLHGSSVSCTYDFADELWLVDVDSGQMSQVIQNLIINAKHAMPDGGNVVIRCTNVKDTAEKPGFALQPGKYVKVVVEDTGSGIPADIIDKIFDPYFSTRPEGSGLGLAICYSIIKKHEGYIVVQSTPGAGTVFTIFLPASKGTGEGAHKRMLLEKSARAARVLVMDDEEMVRTVVKEQLEYLGYEVLLCADGYETIARAREAKETNRCIDVMVLDLTIPGTMGGKDAVRKILEINPNARVIVASGYSNDPVMANYKEYGFAASISKPFTVDELNTVLSSVLPDVVPA